MATMLLTPSNVFFLLPSEFFISLKGGSELLLLTWFFLMFSKIVQFFTLECGVLGIYCLDLRSLCHKCLSKDELLSTSWSGQTFRDLSDA